MRAEIGPQARIIVPLDVREADEAKRAVADLASVVGGFKVGYELGYNLGWKQAADLVVGLGGRVFLDPKLDDIPNTVRQGTKALTRLNPWMVNVHASAGVEAMKGAAEVKGSALLLAVTVLTSMSDQECRRIFGASAEEKVLQFALDAAEAGVDGLVCSPKELDLLAQETKLDRLLRVTPGVRPEWATTDDQRRVMTPADAVQAGSDYLVIGRPILKPPREVGSPVEAAKRIADEIDAVSSKTFTQ